MIWLILPPVLAFLLWYKFIHPMYYFQKLGVPTGNPLPFIGDQYRTISKQMSHYEWLKWIYDQHIGKRYCGFYQFTLPTLMIRDPELIKQITVKDFHYFTDHRPFIDPDADPTWGGNLFSLKGEKWREMRTTLTGSYTTSKIKNMFVLVNEAAVDFVQFFMDKGDNVIEMEIIDKLSRYCNDVIASVAFGIKVDSVKEPQNDFFTKAKIATRFNGLLTRIKFFGYLIFPSLYKIFKISLIDHNVTAFFDNLIKQSIKAREEKDIVRPDMLNHILEGRKNTENGFRLTNDDITSQMLIFFFAGFDTVSTVLSFTAYELVANKHIQDKLRKSIVEIWKATNGNITYEDLIKVKYLDMVISETLRKWPSTSAIDRVVTKPYTIQPTSPQERPLHLKPGDYLFIPLLGLHRDPNYFPDPDKFDPERFNDINKDTIKQCTYMPFGFGPRICIAYRYGQLEVKTLLFHLLAHFEIVPCSRTHIPVKLDLGSFHGPKPENGFWFGLKRTPIE